MNLIKRCFKWAVAEELVGPNILLGLQAVQALKYGRSPARETEPIRPVADEHVDATLPYLTPVVQAMTKLQRLTGMRPCEIVQMRPCDIDCTREVWVYEPATHKNSGAGIGGSSRSGRKLRNCSSHFSTGRRKRLSSRRRNQAAACRAADETQDADDAKPSETAA